MKYRIEMCKWLLVSGIPRRNAVNILNMATAEPLLGYVKEGEFAGWFVLSRAFPRLLRTTGEIRESWGDTYNWAKNVSVEVGAEEKAILLVSDELREDIVFIAFLKKHNIADPKDFDIPPKSERPLLSSILIDPKYVDVLEKFLVNYATKIV
jgi:hypothetical protein